MLPSTWRRGALLVLLALATALGQLVVAAPAGAAPLATQPAPTDPGSALERLDELDRSTAALEEEIDASLRVLEERRTALTEATDVRDGAREDAEAEIARAETLRTEVDGLVVALHGGARTNRLSAMLTADGPQDVLDKMTALDLLGADSADRLDAAALARTSAEVRAAAAEISREQAEASQLEAQRVQDELVERRAALAAQSEEATALLATLDTAAAADPANQVVALRASRTLDRSALVAQPTVGTFTSGYGPRGGSLHGGIDIANSVGTPIVSVASGVVVDAGPAQGFGQWVRVRHEDGTISTYGHIETINTSVGAQVAAGQLIATMGNRGQSSGPHLHLEIEVPGGGKVDPRGWLAQRGVSV